MSAVIEVVTLIHADKDVVFDLELDIDVHAASVHGSGETATTSTGRRQLALGDEVTFHARHFGLPWRMTTRITDYERPDRFVDEQIRGPFRVLRHEHHFHDLGDDGARMTDRMIVSAPFALLGPVVTRLVLVPYLRRLLNRRAAYIRSVAETRGRGA
jgi:ligand-binding SRPBCC domain-containing protein